MNKKKTITKIDIARAAGVSHMTVTRALVNSPLVRETTRRKVRAVCQKLGYRPNLIARSLRLNKSRVFGVVVPTLAHAYYARLISAIEIKAREFGYHLIISQIQGPRLREEHLTFLLGQRIEGLFVVARHSDRPACEQARLAEGSMGFLDNPGPKGAVFIGTDDYNGAITAVNHLISLGHRRIACLAGLADSYAGRKRIRGYQDALKAHGLKTRREDIIITNYSLDGGYQAGELVFNSATEYTAAFCVTDYIAVGLLSWAYNHGIKLPERLSVVGFTGDEIGEYSAPPLTTMLQRADVMGAKAVEQMLALIENRQVTPRILTPPELLTRSSTAEIILQQ
jgi:LacI family transcriptional regulator